MARVESLGIHTPVALPYLIREGILGPEPKRDLYQWETYVFDDGDGDVDEELLVTRTCVVWSQGKFVRNAYRFELEGEEVAQALLTTFPATSHGSDLEIEDDGKHFDRHPDLQGRGRATLGLPPSKLSGPETASASSARALVVFLKTKAHIYFLEGPSHIVDLPFEVERAFPAPRGCVLQRKAASLTVPPTPQLPAAPPNSFFSSQLQSGPSFLQSPTLLKSFRGSQPAKPSPLGGSGAKAQLNGLFQDVFGSPAKDAGEDVASLYSLTSPLSDLGVLTYSLQHAKPRLSTKSQAGLSVEFETLDSAEELAYVSSKGELPHTENGGATTLMVTLNRDLQTMTVWHAWYIEEKSLRALLKQRAAQKAAKARRRSSFLSATVGTGATTPAVRAREHARESFVGPGTLAVPGEAAQLAAPKRRPTKQQEEEAMAHQMDPDYEPAVTQQPARESRRISSLNTDLRASQTNAGTSFAAGGNRRHTSFGPNDRRSFGHRKSRGSTPGSVFSRSIGPDDDLMELDSSGDIDGEESVESVVRHIRATFEAAGADSVFGGVDEGFKRELVVRKLHSMHVGHRPSPETGKPSLKVITLADSLPTAASGDVGLGVYVHDDHTKELHYLKLQVKQRPLWPELPRSLHVAVPLATAEQSFGKHANVTKIKAGSIEALLVGDRGLILSDADGQLCSLPPQAPYRAYNALDLPLQNGPTDMNIGKHRTIQTSGPAVCFTHSGADGAFDELDGSGTFHRKRFYLAPEDMMLQSLLQACQFVLPPQQAVTVRRIWCAASAWLLQHPESLSSTSVGAEWVAFASTVFFFTSRLLDAKAKATLNVSRLSAGKQRVAESAATLLRKQQNDLRSSDTSPWAWLGHQVPSLLSATTSPNTRHQLDRRKDQLVPIAAALADELSQSSSFAQDVLLPQAASLCTVRLMLGLHVFREELKLSMLSHRSSSIAAIPPIIAQLGSWLGLSNWSPNRGTYYDQEGASEEHWAFVRSTPARMSHMRLMDEPVSVYQWFEHSLKQRYAERYPSLATIAALDADEGLPASLVTSAAKLTPRIDALSELLIDTSGLTASAAATVELLAKHSIDERMLETLPQAIAAPFREAIAHCERDPPTAWPPSLLQLVRRDDLVDGLHTSGGKPRLNGTHAARIRDVQTICSALEDKTHASKTNEANRHAVSSLIFHQDKRLVAAVGMMHWTGKQEAECAPQPDWNEGHHHDMMRRVIEFATVRMWALPAGDAMIHYDFFPPLLTEKYSLPGFGSKCFMQPKGITLEIDRTALTEEKVGWAYFHAGVSNGLRISRKVQGIDTSWIAFNKPADLTNRHAGLLLALGLGGHLRSLAKWLSFKYLTPKHTMTSVGLLIGLSASHIGTMDSLITRMLSVHITRMLPQGAAELNVSPITQTAGLMGIGLLYYNTQHRRMSEIMLSEIEYMEVEDPDSGPDPLRDESYRLAAGFALGLINLGKGKDLRGLHGMHLPERLLGVAVGPRPVHAVHVFDRATAGAVVALALVYMKSGDKAIARKVDIPDTSAQYDHVRPDMLLLRTMARHVITWDNIVVPAPKATSNGASTSAGWIQVNLPACYRGKFAAAQKALNTRQALQTADVPFYNILTGLAWAVGLKYAGTGNEAARDEILSVLDLLYIVGSGSYYYDARLARATVRRCVDAVALSAATVMAGTGDLQTFRYLRRLHGRTDADTPYGSHLATHLAIGVLFLGGGTYTFSTSEFAIAALIIAFYPLFPADVHDNRCHLQAFRHFWVFAAEARCLIVEDIDTHKPVKMKLKLVMKDGTTKSLTAPCLLPELDAIATVQTDDSAYWRVTLDFAGNPAHLSAFRNNQTVFVRRCSAIEAHSSAFIATTAALNHGNSTQVANDLWQSIFDIPALRDLDKAELELILPPDAHSAVHADERGTIVDDRLVLNKAATSNDRNALWDLRMLFAWAEKAKQGGDEKLRWLGNEVVEALRATVEERMRATSSHE